MMASFFFFFFSSRRRHTRLTCDWSSDVCSSDLPSDLSALRHGQVAPVRVADPLQGLDECGGTEFSHWVDGARVRLRAEARDALRAALREAELARLEATWHRVTAAGYQTCLVTGAPGIGKSSLIRRFATSVQARAWPVFVVSCQEIGQGIPYRSEE